MTPHTVHRLSQKIRHERALLTTEEKWLQQQEKSETRDEGFRFINFLRTVWKSAEDQLRQL